MLQNYPVIAVPVSKTNVNLLLPCLWKGLDGSREVKKFKKKDNSSYFQRHFNSSSPIIFYLELIIIIIYWSLICTLRWKLKMTEEPSKHVFEKQNCCHFLKIITCLITFENSPIRSSSGRSYSAPEDPTRRSPCFRTRLISNLENSNRSLSVVSRLASTLLLSSGSSEVQRYKPTY